MIELVTGVPGSGKTLFVVGELLRKAYASRTDASGKVVPRRVVVDGIPGLLLPHEAMAPGELGADGVMRPTDGQGVWNWPEWCKPGDVIVIDEVQRWWRPRGNGVKPPPEVAALETHRHKGVDFILITQNPMLLDQNVRRLVGKHTIVRRALGFNRAILYEFDGVQTDVTRTSSATTARYWPYPRDAFALYKSSELHTRQRFKLPLWLTVPVVCAIGGAFALPRLIEVVSGVATGKGFSTLGNPAMAAPASARPASAPQAVAAIPPASAPAIPPAGPPPALVGRSERFSGCIRSGDLCRCFNESGERSDLALDQCQVVTGFGRGPAIDIGPDSESRPQGQGGGGLVLIGGPDRGRTR